MLSTKLPTWLVKVLGFLRNIIGAGLYYLFSSVVILWMLACAVVIFVAPFYLLYLLF